MKSLSDLKLIMEFESTGFIRSLFEGTIFLLFSWVPGIVGIGLRSVFYKLILKGDGLLNIEEKTIFKRPKDIILGRDVFIDHSVYLQGMPGKIRIGDNSAIMHDTEIHPYQIAVPLGKNESKKYYFLPNSGITIGKNTLIGAYSIINGQGKTTIGNNVLMGPNCILVPVNHTFKKEKLIKDQPMVCKGITIEDDVWLGARVTVLDGVTIGKGSVIGAGAVVTKSIPPYSVAVGVPAKVIKKRK